MPYSLDVPGYGPPNADYMIIGEAPGAREYEKRQPFVGLSGQELRWYFKRHKLTLETFYLTNVVKSYISGNPDPDEASIRYWSEHLEREIAAVNPKLIIACGRFAMRWLLGDTAELDECHGMLFASGTYDSSISHRARNIPVISMFHPAWALRKPENRAKIDYDVSRIFRYVRMVQRQQPLIIPYDAYAGKENYLDVSGPELADILSADYRNIRDLAIDTEGTPGREWSAQFCWQAGTAYVLRKSRNDYQSVARILQNGIDGVDLGGQKNGWVVITHDASTPHHGTAYETTMMRGFNVDLARARSRNTMESGFEMVMESRGLKSMAWRFLRCETEDYHDLIDGIGREQQIEYLDAVSRRDDLPETDYVVEEKNDGTAKLKKPQKLVTRTAAIVRDCVEGKVDKDGKPTDPLERWHMIDIKYRNAIESLMQRPFPIATMDDIKPQQRAINYAARDADITFRLDPVVRHELHLLGLDKLSTVRFNVLPMFAEIQHTGMPASRKRFQSLLRHTSTEREKLRIELSKEYFSGKPINPNSDEQVRTLMRRIGIGGEKKTPTGKMSVGKKSIEHYRSEYRPIELVMSWKELYKIESTYCKPILEIADASPIDPRDPDYFLVHSMLDPIKVVHRRLSARDPSLLNQPVRTALGRMVRDCYCVPAFMDDAGYVMGSWDSKGQEMRIAAHISQDRNLIRLFITGGDVHRFTASVIFQVPYDLVTDEQRRLAKTGNFGVLYGQRGFGLQEQFRMNGIMWPIEECDHFTDSIMNEVYPGLGECSRAIGRKLKATGIAEDLFGMRRYLPNAWADEWYLRAEAERQAFSFIVSGTAQGCMQESMSYLRDPIWELRDYGMDIRTLLQVHDELLYLFHVDLWDVIDPLIKDAFTNHVGLDLTVPLEADSRYGKSWAKLK